MARRRGPLAGLDRFDDQGVDFVGLFQVGHVARAVDEDHLEAGRQGAFVGGADDLVGLRADDQRLRDGVDDVLERVAVAEVGDSRDRDGLGQCGSAGSNQSG